MTSNQRCPHCGNTVKTQLTRNRRRRRVENDQYADFLRRAISGYTRRVGQGDIDAIASFSALVAEAGEQLAEAVFLLRLHGYSWTDISIRLGTTRQAAQQRWGTPA
jgi:DNA-directed RNA polymerase specialized sigma24 family protein